MKKRTKKKIKKFAWKATKSILRGVTVVPAKAAWKLTSKKVTTIKENKENKAKKGKNQVDAEFSKLKEIQNMQGDLDNFTSSLYNNKSQIGLILGARGTGKSAIGMRLLENIKTATKKNIYAMGFDSSALPHWIESVASIEQINNNSVVLIDEGGIEFSSRNTMSNANKLLSEILLVARHKDLTVFFITQNSSNLEINVIRQADFLLLKPSSLMQKDFERKKIKQVYESVDEHFTNHKGTKGLTYIYSDSYLGFIKNDLPSFWSEGVSKGYKNK